MCLNGAHREFQNVQRVHTLIAERRALAGARLSVSKYVDGYV
jgi:hypothetical protein